MINAESVSGTRRNPAGQPRLFISIPEQRLTGRTGDGPVDYPISTAANGAGEQNGSFCTPRGRHIIRAKIGDGADPNTVFVGRRPTGEIYRRGMRDELPDRDWILTRILWLSGLEPGVNRLGSVDTMRRYVYIHGAPDEVEMGSPGSAGCIRMRNEDLITLFNQVTVGTEVLISD